MDEVFMRVQAIVAALWQIEPTRVTLRVILMKLEATNAELAGARVQKALPPAPEETPRGRVPSGRWWQLWR
jgi:hypothetical protein